MENEITKQEKKAGKSSYGVVSNMCVDVSQFKGNTYIAIRYWYQTENGWFRKKNGISMSIEDFNQVSSQLPEIRKFVNAELKKLIAEN